MTDQSLESVLSGAGAVASNPESIVDEPEQLIGEEVQNTIGTEQVEGEPHPDEAKPKPDGTGQQEDGKKTVPLAALQEERGKVKRYTEQVADFERKLSDVPNLIQNAVQQALASQAQAQRQAEQPKPDIFENPDGVVQAALQPHLNSFQQMLMANAQLTASSVHGPEKVQQAEQAFLQAMQNGSLDPADYQRVVTSPNRWDAAVKWHKRQTALTEIGDDPAAYRERVKAELLAEIQQTGRVPQPQAKPAPAVMPSNLADARNAGNRSGPAWSGPPALDDIFRK